VTPKHTRILSCDRRQGCPYRKCTWCKRAICIRRNANGATQRVRVRVSVRVRVRIWVRVRVRCTWIMGVNALRHLHCAEYRKPCKRGLFPNSEYSLACWMLCLCIAITSTCNVRGYVRGFGLSLFCNMYFLCRENLALGYKKVLDVWLCSTQGRVGLALYTTWWGQPQRATYKCIWGRTLISTMYILQHNFL